MNSSLALFGWLFLPALILAQDNTKRDMQDMHRWHQDSKAHIAMLDDPKRAEYQKPHEVITALRLKEGEVIADIGAGSGYFTFRLAHHVGDAGRVHAVDVSPEMVLHLNRRIRDLKLENVVTILAAPDDPLLADASVDRIFICDTWHHIERYPGYLVLLKKMLKPGGQIVMVDFKKEQTPMGPPMEMRIDRADLVKEMEKNGFRVAAEHTLLPHHVISRFQSEVMTKAIIFDLDSCLRAADEPGQQLSVPAFDAISHANQGSHSPSVLQNAFTDMWRLPFDFVAKKYGFTPAMKAAGGEVFVHLEVTAPMQGYGDLDVLDELPVLRFLVTSGFRRLQESKLRALGIARCFTAIHVDAIDQPGHRGKQAVFEEILRDHRLQPDQVLIVGDNHDSEIAIGARLGIRTVQTLRPGVPRSAAATHHIQTLRELKPLLDLKG